MTVLNFGGFLVFWWDAEIRGGFLRISVLIRFDVYFCQFIQYSRPFWFWGGDVWRVAYRESLFRLIGFYDSGKQCFIVIDAFMKRGMQLSEGQKKRITEVGRVKRLGSWIRRDHE